MTRPTREQIDRDLKALAEHFSEWGDTGKEREMRLAAEVRALREELEATKQRWAGELNEKYCAEQWGADPQYAVFRKRLTDALATIARVEALLEGYEAHVAEYPKGARSAAIAVYQTVIIEIEAALKGES